MFGILGDSAASNEISHTVLALLLYRATHI